MAASLRRHRRASRSAGRAAARSRPSISTPTPRTIRRQRRRVASFAARQSRAALGAGSRAAARLGRGLADARADLRGAARRDGGCRSGCRLFGSRRERGTEFLERVLNITETMMLADAYSGLAFLATRPEIDPRRVVLTGFSYGAMAAMYALHARSPTRFCRAGPASPVMSRFMDPALPVSRTAARPARRC